MSIYTKLLEIQSKLKVPKGQYNSFGKYKYRSCEDIMEALKPICHEVNTVIVLSDDVITLNGRNYIKATATLIDTETDSKVENTAFAREDDTKKGMDGSQITGACSSYARKYALNGLFGIDDTKDSDYTNTHSKTSGDDEAPKPTIKKEDAPIMCTGCGNEIKQKTNKWGIIIPPSEIVKGTGGVCYECFKQSEASKT